MLILQYCADITTTRRVSEWFCVYAVRMSHSEFFFNIAGYVLIGRELTTNSNGIYHYEGHFAYYKSVKDLKPNILVFEQDFPSQRNLLLSQLNALGTCKARPMTLRKAEKSLLVFFSLFPSKRPLP